MKKKIVIILIINKESNNKYIIYELLEKIRINQLLKIR